MLRAFRTPVLLLAALGTWGISSLALAEQDFLLDIGPPPCVEDADCDGSDEGPWCDGFGSCQECVETMHCPEGAVCNRTFQCIYPCRSEAECPDALPYCDVEQAQCVACLEHGDCDASEYCSFGACFPDFCDAEALFCSASGTAINRCDASGGDFEVETICPDGEVCVDEGGMLGCALPVGGSGSSAGEGGTIGGGTMGGSGGMDAGSAGEAGADGGTGGCRVGGPETPWAASMLVLLGFWAASRRRSPA